MIFNNYNKMNCVETWKFPGLICFKCPAPAESKEKKRKENDTVVVKNKKNKKNRWLIVWVRFIVVVKLCHFAGVFQFNYMNCFVL
jgi:hypothetical protein